uniref:Uncharacterized protein n=1 Tax=Cacopsylla melanoneura TaxID=428564 RepID=A0A8D9F1W2_9HEMI
MHSDSGYTEPPSVKGASPKIDRNITRTRVVIGRTGKRHVRLILPPLVSLKFKIHGLFNLTHFLSLTYCFTGINTFPQKIIEILFGPRLFITFDYNALLPYIINHH